MGLVRLHIVVRGNVQGVGFRYYAQMKAVQHKITGWVKNTNQGTVEMVAVGEKGEMAQFIEDLRQGNPFSKVTEIEMKELSETEPFQSFKIKY